MSAPNDLCRASVFRYLLLVGAVLAGLLASFQVAALGLDKSGWSYYPMPDGRTVVASGGRVIGNIPASPLATSPPTGAPHVSGSRAIAVSGGSVVAKGNATVVVGKAALPVAVTGKVSNSVAAATIRKALPLVGGAAAGPLGLALMTLAVDMGYELYFNKPEGQDPTVTKIQNDYVCPAGSWGNETYPPYWQDPDVQRTKYCVPMSATSSLFLAGFSITSSKYGWNGVTFPCGNATCKTGTLDYGTASNVQGQKNTKVIPSSADEFADDIARKIGWPDSSAIAEALAQSENAVGQPMATQPPTVSGPASAQGPTETTEKPIPNGTRETKSSTEYTCKYIDPPSDGSELGGSVVCAENVTTTDTDRVTNPETNQTTETTTTTSTTKKPAETTAQKPKEETPDPCKENPDRVGCADLDTPEGEVPKTTKEISYTPDILFGNGSCPADKTMTLQQTGKSMVVWNWTQSCSNITTYYRPIVLILSAFVAMMILIPRGEA